MLPNLAKQYLFIHEEIIMLRNCFYRLCDRGIMMIKLQFRYSLGNFRMAERIFNQINKDGGFVKYLSTLLNGSIINKVLWSFGMLSSNFRNLNKWTIRVFQKQMIRKRRYPKFVIYGIQLQVQYLCQKMNQYRVYFEIFDNDGIVQFEEFRVVYQEGVELNR
ncbi:unnamed protein product [Paramecium sonneborni]|uniref:Uncharacterized protein n=1 Tax=Paramecium sonneborni TaxID=65129 RepID=A0A8S1LB96_9CILI|nr:unnamed protein product [Paramecium sonneborni]